MTPWKIYVVAFSVIAIFSGLGRLVLYFKKPGSVSVLDLINGFYNLLMLPALSGFAWHRAIGIRGVWIIAVPVLIILSSVEMFSPKMAEFRAKAGDMKFALAMAAQFALGLPGLYALILYAFFRPNLWA
jgi:hypothetical protein